jgi:protein-disulfide isomerase
MLLPLEKDMKIKRTPWLFITLAILAQACSLLTCPLDQFLPQQPTVTPRPTRTPLDPTRTPTSTRSPAATATTVGPSPGMGDDPFLGPEDAPVTMVVFSDFNCGFCRRFHNETLPLLLQMYPNELRYVYRDFPIVGGGQVGASAAQAAYCAGEQDAYWEYNEALYSGGYSLNQDGFARAAEDLGLDEAALLQCWDSERYVDEIIEDRTAGSSMGVSATPTFFINGILVVGAQELNVFTQIIDDQLGQ